MKIIAEDGTEFATTEACLAHEASFPFIKLFSEVESAVKADAAFAARIEALGFRLRRDRYDRGEMKRTRAPKGDAAPDPTPPPASASNETTTRQSSEYGDGFVESKPDGQVDEAAA